MKRPPPMYMPSWPGIPKAPGSKKTRSPGCNAAGGGDDAACELVGADVAPFPQADEYLCAAGDTRIARLDAQTQAHITRLLADHRLLADDQVTAGVELEERIRARIPQQALDDEPGDRSAASVPDRDAVGVDASAEHGDVVELDARLSRENFADREHRAVPRIGEGAVTGSREQLAVPRAYLCRAENVGRRRRRPDERDRDHECEGAHPPAR